MLPNVFTPNNDGNNDAFQALMPIRYINAIDMHIFNRWGLEVFNTTNPLFSWDGINLESGLASPSGVYYYNCTIEALRLQGM